MGWANPDAMASNRTSIQGAAGTYNHLTDAILDVAATREMYLRRLRTLADTYYGGGRLKQVGGVYMLLSMAAPRPGCLQPLHRPMCNASPPAQCCCT
jgi:hypothetical protein